MQQNSERRSGFYRPVHQAIIILLVTTGLLALLAAIYTVRWILVASLVGIGIGTLIIPLAEKGRARIHAPRVVTSVFLLLVFYGVFFLVGYALVTMISQQIVPVLQNVPHLIAGVESKVSQFSRAHPFVGKAGANVNLRDYETKVPGALLSGIRMGASLVGGLVFIFFVALYLAVRPSDYLDGMVSAFPKHLRPKARYVVHESANSLRRWFWAQLTAMLTVAIIAAIALKIVSSPFWLFFGAIAFVLELIPYFGPLTALATVCIVTLASNPHAFIKTAIAFSVVLFLEGNVIIPVVMKGRAKLSPVHLLILISVLGTWFGVFGFLMAAPLLSVLKTIYTRAYLPRMDEERIPPSEMPPQPASQRPAA